MLHDRMRSEEGVALIFALFAIIILGGIAAVMVSLARAELRATAQARDFEAAIHVAEAGADVVIAALNDDRDHLTSGPSGAHALDPSTVSTPADRLAWARSVANGNCTLVETGFGETCGIRPVDVVSGRPLNVIYGVGYVPTRANPSKVRVVRIEFDRGFFKPSKAIVTGGDLTISGNATIGGLEGNVHSNGDLNVSGGSVSISGDLSYSGTLVGDSTGTATAAPPEPLTAATARSLYPQALGHYATSGGAYTGDWYDLCPDGRVRAPDIDTANAPDPLTAPFYPPGLPAGRYPCSGEVLWDATTAEFRGWEPSGAKWQISGNSCDLDGIYYVFGRNATISGNPGSKKDGCTTDRDGDGVPDGVKMTILVEALPADHAAPNPCVAAVGDNGSLSGNFTMSGNTVWFPFLGNPLPTGGTGVAVIADRDIQITGNPDQDFAGFYSAHEQVKLSGNPSMVGAIQAEDACDVPGSPVHENSISGNISLTFDGGLNLPLEGIVRITAWNEL